MSIRRHISAVSGTVAAALVCGLSIASVPTAPEKATTNAVSAQVASVADRAPADAQLDPARLSPWLGDALTSGPTRTSIQTRFSADLVQTAFDTLEEQACLAEAVYYEARSEALPGQKAVAEVVLNRVASKHFPNTVCGVVYQGSGRHTGCQFSFTCDGSRDDAPTGRAWERSQAVADLALTGGIMPFTGRATHYHTTDIKPAWSDNLRMTKRVGSHVFYRFAPLNYVPSAPTMVVAPPT